MKRLIKYIKPNLLFFIIALSSTLSNLILDLFNPRIIQKIIDEVLIDGNINVLTKLLTFITIITISRAFFGYLREYFMDIGGARLTTQLRIDLFDHLQSLSFDFFDKTNTGELMSRIKEDIDNIWFTFGFGVMLLFEQICYFLLASIILFSINFWLTFIIVLIMPIIAIIAYRLEVEADKVYEEISDQGVKLNTTAQEDIAGIRMVKAFGREKYEIEKFFKQNKRNYELNVKQAKITAKYNPLIEFISNFSIALSITIGGLLVTNSKMSIGTLVAYSGYVTMLVWPMRLLGWLINMVSQCRASLKKINNLFMIKPSIVNSSDALKPSIKGKIEFKNVYFKYKDQYVLKNISFTLENGKTLAIMGTTGAGKTSIVNLIGRFYDIDKGQILIDGIDIKDIDLKTLRDSVGYVLQDVFLFSDSIIENIRFGNPKISIEDIISSLKDAKAYNFVMKLPEKLNTIIGERGIGLSGGQKQRLSITRAIARKPAILIFDDATSSLDMETEKYIQKELKKYEGITKIIIAHRISAVKDADHIILLENGEIVEEGTHGELILKKGIYYQIYMYQYGEYITNFEEELT